MTAASSAWHLLLVHGFLGSPEDWDEVIRDLPAGWTFDAVRLPGHGMPLADGPEVLDDLVGAVARAAAQAPAGRRAAWVGYSMGGRVLLHALRLGQAVPDALVLCSVSPGMSNPELRASRRERDRLWAEMMPGDWPWFLDAWYRQPLFATLAGAPEARDRMMARRRALASWAPDLARIVEGFSPGEAPDCGDVLARVADRTLLVAGEKDPAYASLLHHAPRLYPGVNTRTVPGAGHALAVEQPARLAGLIRDFLETHEP